MVLRPEVTAIETPVGVDTPFQGIQLLAPATLLAFDTTTSSIDQMTWWRLEDRAPFTGTYSEALAKLSTVLAEQIPLRVPGCDFALLLSGGLDSAVLAYLMRPPVCVTVRYRGQDRLDESSTAEVIAPYIGAELIVVEPDHVDFTTVLPHMMRALDYPMGNASTFSEHMAYRKISDLGLRVVVGGLGPDEFLMGYVRQALVLPFIERDLDALIAKHIGAGDDGQVRDLKGSGELEQQVVGPQLAFPRLDLLQPLDTAPELGEDRAGHATGLS
ncbi:asparagine synthase-related protein [Streptomyces cyaneofuscatus]|uniref:asparagine synthase-related protein n=1 Tax=Streptomyces cyaneofuscatus TaxID=66883 RepID=UPI0037F8A1DE